MQYRHQYAGDKDFKKTGGAFSAWEHFKYLKKTILTLWDTDGFKITRQWMDKIVFDGMDPRAADADIEAAATALAVEDENAQILAALLEQNTCPGADSHASESPPLPMPSNALVPAPDRFAIQSSASASLSLQPPSATADQTSARRASAHGASALSSSSSRSRIIPVSAIDDISPTFGDDTVGIDSSRFAAMHLDSDNVEVEPNATANPPPKNTAGTKAAGTRATGMKAAGTKKSRTTGQGTAEAAGGEELGGKRRSRREHTKRS